jgi:hypothetical protein
MSPDPSTVGSEGQPLSPRCSGPWLRLDTRGGPACRSGVGWMCRRDGASFSACGVTEHRAQLRSTAAGGSCPTTPRPSAASGSARWELERSQHRPGSPIRHRAQPNRLRRLTPQGGRANPHTTTEKPMSRIFPDQPLSPNRYRHRSATFIQSPSTTGDWPRWFRSVCRWRPRRPSC